MHCTKSLSPDTDPTLCRRPGVPEYGVNCTIFSTVCGLIGDVSVNQDSHRWQRIPRTVPDRTISLLETIGLAELPVVSYAKSGREIRDG